MFTAVPYPVLVLQIQSVLVQHVCSFDTETSCNLHLL